MRSYSELENASKLGEGRLNIYCDSMWRKSSNILLFFNIDLVSALKFKRFTVIFVHFSFLIQSIQNVIVVSDIGRDGGRGRVEVGGNHQQFIGASLWSIISEIELLGKKWKRKKVFSFMRRICDFLHDYPSWDTLYICISSAYSIILLNITGSLILLIYIEKSKADNVEPWGTPTEFNFHSETLSFTLLIACTLPSK